HRRVGVAPTAFPFAGPGYVQAHAHWPGFVFSSIILYCGGRMCTRLRPATDWLQHVTDDQLSQRTMAQYALRATMHREERPAWISANVGGLARVRGGIRWLVGMPGG